MTDMFSAKAEDRHVTIAPYAAVFACNADFKEAAKILLRRLGTIINKPVDETKLNLFLDSAAGSDPQKPRILLGFKATPPAKLDDLQPSDLVSIIGYRHVIPKRYDIDNHYAQGRGEKIGTSLMWGALLSIHGECAAIGLNSAVLRLKTAFRRDLYKSEFNFIQTTPEPSGEYCMQRSLDPTQPLSIPPGLQLRKITLP